MAGPSSVNASVLTIRGTVRSSWVRHNSSKGACRFELWAAVPVGSLGRVVLPLLGADPAAVTVVEAGAAATVWGGAGAPVPRPHWLRAAARSAVGPDGDAAIELDTAAGEYHFRVLV